MYISINCLHTIDLDVCNGSPNKCRKLCSRWPLYQSSWHTQSQIHGPLAQLDINDKSVKHEALLFVGRSTERLDGLEDIVYHHCGWLGVFQSGAVCILLLFKLL